jgi:aldehyde dehydrogenase (NAD+)
MNQIAEIFDTMAYGPAPEESGAVRAWLKSHAAGMELFIGGQWRKPLSSSARIASVNPANGEHLADIAEAGAEDVDAAVKAAAAALPAWSRTPGHQRARVLYALARLVQKHSRFFAVLETLDNGKPIRETRDIDIPLVARHFYYHAGWAQLIERELPGYEPQGVVGQIIPWNFPLLMLAWKVAPALAAGNCVVLKPSEYTSLTALFFAELCAQAHVPPGVLNIVTGGGATGAAIVEHPGIAKIAFTGSTRVGRYIRTATAGTGKSLTLELGGKSPFLVMDDADLDAAVEGLIDAIWFNQGQVCCAGSRLLLEEGIAERMIAKIKVRLNRFRIGDPLDKAVDMGSLISPLQYQRVTDLVAQGVSQGATIWQPDITCPEGGCFYRPTLLTDVAPANIVAREEIFGPVLTVTTFRSLGEAVELANNTRYGLAATVYSENINRALDLAGRLKSGVVWINTTNQFDAACGFGGVRESGFGREGGLEGMLDYLRPTGEWLAPAAADEPGAPASKAAPPAMQESAAGVPLGIDRTAKNYIGGKQTRPDGGNSRAVVAASGQFAGYVSESNRKDIRDAVEAAHKAEGWSKATAHLRAQILYYLAENLCLRQDEFSRRLQTLTAVSAAQAGAEVDACISRLFAYAAWADKFDGQVHTPPVRNVALAVNEPIGVIGIVCPDEAPLLAFISLVAPAVALGNRCVVIPSQAMPLLATDFYQVIETSDVPEGVINIVTGDRDVLARVLADHDQVEAVWYFGSAAGSAVVETSAAATIKRSWVNHGRRRDWASTIHGEGRVFLRHASQVKNIWLPYGD